MIFTKEDKNVPKFGTEENIEAQEVEEEVLDWEVQYDRQIQLPDSAFGPLLPYVQDKHITDVDFNGRDLWITYSNNKKELVPISTAKITKQFAMQFAKNVSNHTGEEFNQLNPRLEGETKTLRFSIMHPVISRTGVSICIRKTPPYQMITEKTAIEEAYASKEILSLLANCVKAHMNIVICGLPRAGKTELGKYLSTYIPDYERVITIEDVLEWRYRDLKPNSDCLEWQTFGEHDFTDLTIASLKQNPTWIMIAETRGKEVQELINGFSTGVHGMTTLHTDDVRNIPWRMLNMINNTKSEDHILDNIYEFVDVGVLVSIRMDEETGEQYRMIEQVGFYYHDNGAKVCELAVANGCVFPTSLHHKMMKKFQRAGVKNLYQNDELDDRLRAQGVEPKEPEFSVYTKDTGDYISQITVSNYGTGKEDKTTVNKDFEFQGYQTPEERVNEYMNRREA